jgi:SAM-dependent methyltransferase
MLPDPPTTDPTSLYEHRDRVCVADLLIVAVAELDLFTELDQKPGSVPELAARLGVAERPLDVLLTLCAALELVERAAVTSCTPLAQQHLVRGSPFYLGPYYASLRGRSQVREMLEVVRTGQPASWNSGPGALDWVEAMQDEGFAAEFTAAMDCRGSYLAPALARAVPLTGHSRLLDIAGGSGVYACALVQANPGLRATVLERSPMDRVAAKHLAQREFADRVDSIAGDMLEQPYPEGHDVHLISNVLHDWGEVRVRELLAKSAQALPPDGRLVIFDAHLNDDKTGPLAVAEYSVFLMHATEGRCYSVQELSGWLEEYGMSDVTHVPVVAHRSAVVSVKK